MPHPKKKSTKTSGRDRASHFALKNPSILDCSKCGSPRRAHTACLKCGTYRKSTVKTKSKKA